MKLILFLLPFSALLAQSPQIVNARYQNHAVSGSLEDEIRRMASANGGPEWVAFAEPMIPGNRSMCCSNGGGCWLEQRQSGDSRTAATAPGPVKLEGPTEMLILFRLANHAIDQLKVHSIDCELDAGGLPFTFLTGVSAADSVNYLSKIAPDRRQAVMAIALQAGPVADSALERLSKPGQSDKVREQAAFWLGSARGLRGVEILKGMLASDASDHVRGQIMFGLSISKEPSALAQLIDSARNDRSPRAREKALFWLAQKAGRKETEAITRAIAEDPDLRVKKQAVFGLKQLPPDEGIPLLIQVARTNANPEVRKQAIFWLGQSRDERALKFFEEILTKKP